MQKVLICLLLLWGLCPSSAEAQEENVYDEYLLGDSRVMVWTFAKGAGLTLFAPHDDENISAAIAMEHVNAYGGRIVQLSHSGKRNISFTEAGVRYEFDPNRMFSDAGIEASLKEQGNTYSKEAHAMVKNFAREVLLHLKAENLRGRPLVAVHNNSNGGNYSLSAYQRGGRYSSEASKVNRSPTMDPDDFFFVTDGQVFDALASVGQNVVLQNNKNVTDDGSLSVRAAKAKVPYVNIEAQEDGSMGHGEEQAEMLLLLRKLFP